MRPFAIILASPSIEARVAPLVEPDEIDWPGLLEETRRDVRRRAVLLVASLTTCGWPTGRSACGRSRVASMRALSVASSRLSGCPGASSRRRRRGFAHQPEETGDRVVARLPLGADERATNRAARTRHPPSPTGRHASIPHEGHARHPFAAKGEPMGAYHGWGSANRDAEALRRRRATRRALTLVAETTRDVGRPPQRPGRACRLGATSASRA